MKRYWRMRERRNGVTEGYDVRRAKRWNRQEKNKNACYDMTVRTKRN